MKKALYKIKVQGELNNNLKEMEVHILAENYDIAESTLWIKMEKGGFNMKQFKVLEVENIAYMESL